MKFTTGTFTPSENNHYTLTVTTYIAKINIHTYVRTYMVYGYRYINYHSLSAYSKCMYIDII